MTGVAWVFAGGFVVALWLLVIACGGNHNIAKENRRLRSAIAAQHQHPATLAHIAHHEAADLDNEWAAFNQGGAA